MAEQVVKCPECGREFPVRPRWKPLDWALYVLAVGPIGAMCVALIALAVITALRMLGVAG